MRRGEILKLRWEQVDFKVGVIRLESKQTKNKHARVAPIYTAEMRGFLEMAKTRRDKDWSKCLWVIAFNGEPISSLKTTWKRACLKLGIDDSMFHDLRRTALSNMEEAGIPRSTAMMISGHRTESAYKRYLIGSETRVIEAGKKMEQYWQAKEQPTAELKQ